MENFLMSVTVLFDNINPIVISTIAINIVAECDNPKNEMTGLVTATLK